MTDRIAEITERLGKATPGEWVVLKEATPGFIGLSSLHPAGYRHDLSWAVGMEHNNRKEDAEFIAHAKQDVQWLLAENARLQSALSVMSARVEGARREGLEQARKAVEAMPLYEEIKPGYQSARKHGLHDAVRVIHALSARDKDHG